MQQTESVTVEAEPRTAATLLDPASERVAPRRHVWYPTGFDPFDEVLDGGIRPQELLVVGGRPGVGKTMATLQWARWMAMAGHTAIYASYEHDERMLLERLLLLELRQLVDADALEALEDLRDAVQRTALGIETAGIVDDTDDALLQRAVARVRSYADRLLLVRASGAFTRLKQLAALVAEHGDGDTVLFVDHILKIPNGPDPIPETEHAARVARGLKELALTHDAAVVAVAPATGVGLTAPRARSYHLQGAESLAYEADAIVMLNEKYTAVSKAHRDYDSVKAETFRHRVVFSVEKNRRGQAGADLEFTKDFRNGGFDPDGAFVAERLVDDVVVEA